MTETSQPSLSPFNRRFFDPEKRLTTIGRGSLGGKAQGLAFIHEVLAAQLDRAQFPNIPVTVPTLTVICTDFFDAFMKRNDLHDIANSDEPDDRIAHAFQKADLPVELLGDLRALVEQVRQPLAVRSSSLLEDALHEPFAGIYETKMTPNNQPDPDARFRRLTEAIKLVYASTFFKAARDYRQATGHGTGDEKMAVIIQEVVGRHRHERFYPEVAGVARSYNFYPLRPA
ncbi:MAG TPA: PEP/pyruvate-binding domain-containing protein, partial [bacterium]